jgi:hypothetical protein
VESLVQCGGGRAPMNPHDFSKSSTTPVSAHPAWTYTCAECNWTQFIATEDAPPIKQCAWCGWPEIEATQIGAFATLHCKTHGRVTCLIAAENIGVDDFMELSCPHCERR